MDNLSEKAFRDSLNSNFTVLRGEADKVDLELIDCTDHGSTATQEQFSILFRGPLEPFLDQTTYEMQHEKLGDVAIFIVPVKRDAESIYYEAVYNRSLKAQ